MVVLEAERQVLEMSLVCIASSSSQGYIVKSSLHFPGVPVGDFVKC